MKTIHVDIENTNMMQSFASEQFYETWAAFIRELLINAIDACNMRQALEWSWGTEFLEMEQAEQIKTVREPYEPHIIIAYRSDSRLFTIEDNGIGINEYDLINYVSRIGKSYYTSKDFYDQRVSYVPISKHGIGLCSCFMAARAILIESKKDNIINTAWMVNNQQDCSPIMAKWFEDNPQIEYVPSKKKTSGTRVALPLRQNYDPFIDMDFLVQTIKHFTMYQPIPITILYDNRKVVLNQPHLTWRFPHSEVLGSTIIEVDDELLEGYIAIYNDGHKDFFGRSEIFQQNIRVTEDAQSLGIQPEWLRNFTYQLNIKTRFLNMNLSRSTAARDDKLLELRQRVGQIIINHFGRQPLTLEQYMSDGRYPIVGTYKAETELVSRAVQVWVYLKEQEVEVPVRTVIKGFMGRKINIAFMAKSLFYYYKKGYTFDYTNFAAKYDMVIYEHNIRAFMQFIAPYVTDMHYVVNEDIQGLIYTHISADMTVEKDTNPKRGRYITQPAIPEEHMEFCLVSNELTSPLELVLNPANRNVMLLDRAQDHIKVRRLMAVIKENIKRRILNPNSRWTKALDFGGEYLEEYKSLKALSMQCVWCLEKDFPNELNELVVTILSPKELADYGLTSLYFTKDDFISWWISP